MRFPTSPTPILPYQPATTSPHLLTSPSHPIPLHSFQYTQNYPIFPDKISPDKTPPPPQHTTSPTNLSSHQPQVITLTLTSPTPTTLQPRNSPTRPHVSPRPEKLTPTSTHPPIHRPSASAPRYRWLHGRGKLLFGSVLRLGKCAQSSPVQFSPVQSSPVQSSSVQSANHQQDREAGAGADKSEEGGRSKETSSRSTSRRGSLNRHGLLI